MILSIKSAHNCHALLGVRLGSGGWLRRKLQNSCLLTRAQVVQQDGLPIRKFERVVM